MNETIKVIASWARYIAAVGVWFADSIASFPKRKDYIHERTQAIDSEQA